MTRIIRFLQIVYILRVNIGLFIIHDYQERYNKASLTSLPTLSLPFEREGISSKILKHNVILR